MYFRRKLPTDLPSRKRLKRTAKPKRRKRLPSVRPRIPKPPPAMPPPKRLPNWKRLPPKSWTRLHPPSRQLKRRPGNRRRSRLRRKNEVFVRECVSVNVALSTGHKVTYKINVTSYAKINVNVKFINMVKFQHNQMNPVCGGDVWQSHYFI